MAAIPALRGMRIVASPTRRLLRLVVPAPVRKQVFVHFRGRASCRSRPRSTDAERTVVKTAENCAKLRVTTIEGGPPRRKSLVPYGLRRAASPRCSRCTSLVSRRAPRTIPTARFSPEGQLLMTLGVAGNDENHFRSPAGVVTAPNGDIFIADGHGWNNRIREVREGRQVHQGMGKNRIRAGRVPGRALHRHGQAGPAVRMRPLQCPHPDLRPGWEVSGEVVPIRDAERHRLLDQ